MADAINDISSISMTNVARFFRDTDVYMYLGLVFPLWKCDYLWDMCRTLRAVGR